MPMRRRWGFRLPGWHCSQTQSQPSVSKARGILHVFYLSPSLHTQVGTCVAGNLINRDGFDCWEYVCYV